MIILMIIIVMLGVPVGVVLGGLALIFGYITLGADFTSILPNKIYSTMTQFSFVAVTLFIFMGIILERSGIANKAYDTLYLLMGRIKGSLLLITIILATLLAACTGISGASAVAIGLIALPSMLSHKYNKSIAAGTVCAGAGLGVIIPPSVMLIMYGPIAKISIAKLFFAALIPGLIIAGLFALFIMIFVYCYPEIAPSISIEENDSGIRTADAIKMILISIVPPFLIIIVILGSILFGIASPTEAAAVGVFASLILSLAYRKLNAKMLKECLWTTIITTSMMLFIALSAGMFTTIFLALGSGDFIGALALKISSKFWTIVFMLSLVFILGAVMDWIGMIFILVPIFNPIIELIGIDPLWFGILFCVTLQVSYVTPPFSYSVFFVKSIAPPEISLGDIYKGVLPFIVIQIIGIALFYIFPELTLWLPGILHYG